MPDPHHRPVDARVMPRFAGIRTFMRAPHTTDLAGGATPDLTATRVVANPAKSAGTDTTTTDSSGG